MCSNLEEGELFPTAGISEDRIEERKCMKCDQKAIVSIRINDPFCKDCFLSHCTHKFRSSFGKSKLIRDQEQVLVAFSGGRCSSAMRHLIQEGTSKRAQKKLRFTPSLVYIDDSNIMKKDDKEKDENLNFVANEMKKTGLKSYVYSFEQVMGDLSPKESAGCDIKPDINEVEDLAQYLDSVKLEASTYTKKLQDLLSTAKTLTAKENMIFMLRQRLLTRIAEDLGFGKVLVGDSGTRLSIRLLSNITQGRGAHLPFETAFADTRNSSVMIIRPMREFPDKEIVMYNKLNNIECLFTETPGTKQAAGSSVDRLTEEFVLGLQAEYPNTCSTIFRTGEKLDKSSVETSDSDKMCSMCQAPLDTQVGVSSALAATEFSQDLAQTMAAGRGGNAGVTTCTNATTGGECCGTGDGECQSKATLSFTSKSLRPVLCYGCRLVAKDLDDCSNLPTSWLDAASHQLNRREMKSSIQEFLLDDSAE